MLGYAAQRFFFHASLWVFFPLLFVSAGFFLDHEYRYACVSIGIAAAAMIYRSAFFTGRDVRRPTGSARKQDPEPP